MRVCMCACLCLKEAVSHALIISLFFAKSRPTEENFRTRGHKRGNGVIVSDTRMCLCLPLAAPVEPKSTTTTS